MFIQQRINRDSSLSFRFPSIQNVDIVNHAVCTCSGHFQAWQHYQFHLPYQCLDNSLKDQSRVRAWKIFREKKFRWQTAIEIFKWQCFYWVRWQQRINNLFYFRPWKTSVRLKDQHHYYAPLLQCFRTIRNTVNIAYKEIAPPTNGVKYNNPWIKLSPRLIMNRIKDWTNKKIVKCVKKDLLT